MGKGRKEFKVFGLNVACWAEISPRENLPGRQVHMMLLVNGFGLAWGWECWALHGVVVVRYDQVFSLSVGFPWNWVPGTTRLPDGLLRYDRGFIAWETKGTQQES